MELVRELLPIMFCVLSAGCVGWIFLGWLFRPMTAKDVQIVVIGRGRGEYLESRLQYLSWLRRLGLLTGSVIIWDGNMKPEGRELALRLALRWPWITCCPSCMLEEWVMLQEE